VGTPCSNCPGAWRRSGLEAPPGGPPQALGCMELFGMPVGSIVVARDQPGVPGSRARPRLIVCREPAQAGDRGTPVRGPLARAAVGCLHAAALVGDGGLYPSLAPDNRAISWFDGPRAPHALIGMRSSLERRAQPRNGSPRGEGRAPGPVRDPGRQSQRTPRHKSGPRRYSTLTESRRASLPVDQVWVQPQAAP